MMDKLISMVVLVQSGIRKVQAGMTTGFNGITNFDVDAVINLGLCRWIGWFVCR